MKPSIIDKKCCYEGCKKPEESSQFIQIDGNSTAGGQDWKGLNGKVICNACYNQFFKKGTLIRSQNQGKALPDSSKRCTYEGCKKPEVSSRFFKIDGESTAGDKDWKPIANRVLCHTCYLHYRARGTLERGQPLPAAAKKCSYAGCKRPDESRQFILIDGASTAGGQDWKTLVHRVLCHTCYYQFLRRGTLERSKARPPPTSQKVPVPRQEIQPVTLTEVAIVAALSAQVPLASLPVKSTAIPQPAKKRRVPEPAQTAAKAPVIAYAAPPLAPPVAVAVAILPPAPPGGIVSETGADVLMAAAGAAAKEAAKGIKKQRTVE